MNMAQTVKIPDSSNPFVVKINNDEYSYPAGTTQSVPDEVASVIAAHNSAQPIPDKSAGLISWNDLKDRPFYDKPLVSVQFQTLGGKLYKVSDFVPTGDHSVGASCIVVYNLVGEKQKSNVIISTDDYYAAAAGTVVVALKDNVTMPEEGLTLPERGTYFLSTANSFVSGFALGLNADPEITWDGSTGEIKTLDEKFLPPVSGLIVKSSTTNSTKKFKITVDDSGTISATEV